MPHDPRSPPAVAGGCRSSGAAVPGCSAGWTADRLVAAGMAACFAILLLLKVHGFSLAFWGQVLPEAEAIRPLAGRPRAIRSDDWMAQLPAIISQAADDPAFPPVNHIMHPDGHPMRVGMTAPVRAWEAVFKPTIWGYFVSPDFGLAWHWQVRLFLLAGASTAFFRSVLGASPGQAVWGALCLVLSSFFAYWSFISEPITGLGLLAAVLIQRHLRGTASGLWELGLLFWSLVAFALTMLYPPFQIPMVYLVAATTLWTAAESRRESGRWPLLGGARVLAVIALAVVVIGLHFRENQAALTKILDTEYPGRRVSTGGDLSPGRLLTMSLLPLERFRGSPELNTSEAGSSFFVGLAAIPLAAVCWRRLPPVARSLALTLGGLTAITAIYSFAGTPVVIAKLTGWSRVPGPRTLGIWTVLNVCWLVWWVRFSPRDLGRRAAAGWALATGLLIALAAVAAWGDYPFLTAPVVALGGLLVALTAILIQFAPRWGQAATLAILAAGSISFNPLDRCTHSRILAVPVVRDLQRQFAASGKEAILLLDGDPKTANFPRLIGIPAFGGMHLVPQFAFWRTLDPEGLNVRRYNRFAHVVFSRGPADAPTTFETPHPDVLHVFLSPADIERLSERAWVKDRLW